MGYVIRRSCLNTVFILGLKWRANIGWCRFRKSTVFLVKSTFLVTSLILFCGVTQFFDTLKIDKFQSPVFSSRVIYWTYCPSSQVRHQLGTGFLWCGRIPAFFEELMMMIFSILCGVCGLWRKERCSLGEKWIFTCMTNRNGWAVALEQAGWQFRGDHHYFHVS